MNRYNYNSRLYKDSLEKQEHYKLYKKGKLWLVAGISVFTSGLSYTMLSSHPVHADTTATYNGDDAQATGESSTATATATKPVTATSTSESNNSSQSSAVTATSDANSSSTTTGDQSSLTNSATTGSTNSTSSSTTGTTDQTNAATTDATNNSTKATSQKKTTKVNKKVNNQLKVKKVTYKKLTKYNKKSAQSIVNRANKIMKATQTQINKGNKLANAKENDNIPQDEALTAIGTHQKAQQAQVLKTIKAAQKIAVKNQKQATTKLNSALTVVANMHTELNQATALVSADKKGVKAHVVANAKAAYNDVSVPNGTSAKVDDYGDLIITTGNTKSYNKVLANLHKQGLTKSFRQVVDPAEAANLTFTASKWDDGSQQIIVNSDGSATYVYDRQSLYDQSIPFNFSYSGNKGDTFHVTIPASLTNKQGYENTAIATGSPKQVTNKDGSVTYTWTVQNDGETSNQTINLTGMGNANYGVLSDMGSGTPATGGLAGPIGSVADQSLLPISYGGTNLTDKTTSITIQNTNKINKLTLGTVGTINTLPRIKNIDYIYSLSGGMTKWGNSLNGSVNDVDIEVNVPATFSLDAEKTQQYMWQHTPINSATVEISQPGGVGTPVVFKTKEGRNYNVFNSSLYFIGSYGDSTQTGQQTFSIGKAVYSKNFGNTTAPVALDNGSEKGLTPKTSALNGSITFDGTSNKLIENVAASTGKAASTYLYNANSQNELVVGNQASNVLNNFGITSTGQAQLNATIIMALPDSVESTGLYIPLLTKAYGTWASGNSYNVKINFTNGTSQEFKDIKEGSTLSTIAQTGSVNTTTMFTVPTGASVKSYEITPNFVLNPGETMWGKIGWGGEVLNQDGTENDVQTTSFATLGYVKNGVADKTNVPFVLTVDDNDTGQAIATKTTTATALINAPISLDATQSFNKVLNPGDTFTVSIGDGSKPVYKNPNMNANGFYVNNQPNSGFNNNLVNHPSAKDENDMPGYYGVALTKKGPSLLHYRA
ncbi:KxYKxGKxW signal peptide domain-containing protein [Lentilactobacillus rapi]|uniref:KxYKxGKxW signal peptide domain-containing protein n=1 Tax=Lentilactobacillus rapi TaxID=481723 RepID=UPI0006CFF5C3|nr:KxYKxGKxW signal peptide domain-containing protein [Lentilactobacillus rapi]